MVKAPMQKKSSAVVKSSRAASSDEIKEAIEQAMRALNLEPVKGNFPELAARVGVASSTLYGAYRGDHGLGAAALKSVRLVSGSANRPRNDVSNAEIVKTRNIPLVTWAQAGQWMDYDELPVSWQKTVHSHLTDPAAFAVQIAGDSMEPRYHAGDIAHVSPSEPISPGNLVVAQLAHQGVVLKIYSRSGDVLRFTSYNPVHPPFDVPVDQVLKIYRVAAVMTIP